MTRLKTIIRKLIFAFTSNDAVGKHRPFEIGKDGIRKRNYTSYSEYLEHQKEKLSKNLDSISQHDKEYEALVTERYKAYFEIHRGKSILSLAARLGGEVRAFKKLGLLSVGVDLEPGMFNPYVLHGDFHDLQFSEEVFDFAFCNAIDHVYDLNVFLKETHRILKKEGMFIIELALVNPSKYESIDTSQFDKIDKIISGSFELLEKVPLVNTTSYGEWEGLRLHYLKI